MGIMDRIRDFFGYNEAYYDEEFETEDYNEPDMTLIDSGVENDFGNYSSGSYTNSRNSSGTGNVVSLSSGRPKLRVVVVKPERFDEANIIADHLNSKRTVVLNLESANKDESRRLIDFLSGVAYANEGEIKRVANSTYLITPYNVDIQDDDVIGELQDSGVFFGG